MESQLGFCQLCFCTIWDTNFEEVGETMKEISDVIFFSKNLQLIKGQVICRLCSHKIRSAFNFKCTCIYTEDILFPFSKAIGTTYVDLKEAYLKTHKHEGIISLPEVQKICRLCLQLVSRTYTSLLDSLELDMIHKFIPDIAIQNTIDPVACETCTKYLYEHSSFINDCLYIHEKKMRAVYINNKLMADPYKQTETKCDKVESRYMNITVKEEIVESQKIYNESIHNSLLELLDRMNKAPKEPKVEIVENFDSCRLMNPTPIGVGNTLQEIAPSLKPTKIEETETIDKGKVLYDLDSHLLKHEESKGENIVKEVFNVSHSDYKSKYRRPKKKSNRKTYNCEECSYYSNYSNGLKSHQLNHRPLSEIEFYSCDKCDYKSKYKYALKSHQLNHKLPSEIQMRECELCVYKTKHRTALVFHMLKHRKPSEIKMYKCDMCDFQTKFKHALKPHIVAKHKV